MRSFYCLLFLAYSTIQNVSASGMHLHPAPLVMAEPHHVDIAPVAIAPPVVAPPEVIHPPPVVAAPEVIHPPPVVAPQKVIVPPPVVAPQQVIAQPVPVPVEVHEHPRTEVRNVVSHYAKEAGHTSATAMVSGDDHHGIGHGLIGHGLLGHGLHPGGLLGGDMHFPGGLGGGIIGRKAAVKAAKKKTT